MKRSNLHWRVSKFTPKKFYEIDPWFEMTFQGQLLDYLVCSVANVIKLFWRNYVAIGVTSVKIIENTPLVA